MRTMNRHFSFDPVAFQKRNLPWLTILLIISCAVDVILVWQLRSLEQVVLTEPQGFVYGRIGLWFLLLLNTLLLKTTGIYWYFHRKSERKLGTVTLLNDSAFHIDRVTRYTRLQVRLRLGTCPDKEKQFYAVEDRYQILSVDEVNQDRSGDLHIKGVIEMQLINEFFDCIPDLDWDISQKVLLTKHTIPAYYTNMDELFSLIQTLNKQRVEQT